MVLQERLGRPVPYLAWPLGAYNEALISGAVRAGYSALFTIEWGRNGAQRGRSSDWRAYVSGFCRFSDFRAILEDGRSRVCDATLGQKTNDAISSALVSKPQ